MRLDATARRLLPLILGIALGVAAWLQAQGLRHLTASCLATPARATTSSGVVKTMATPAVDHSTSADDILAQNPFDSVTGPIDRRKRRDREGSDVAQALFVPPGGEPDCENVDVVLIVGSSDGPWAFAAVAGPDGARILRRAGDRVGDQVLVGVGWDRVWMSRDGEHCQARLGGRTAKPALRTPALAAGPVRRTADGAAEIDRTTLEAVLAGDTALLKGTRVKRGAGGFEIRGIRPGSPLQVLGLEDGDRIERVNGLPVGTMEEVLQAYARLRTSNDLTLALSRKGAPRTLDVRVR